MVKNIINENSKIVFILESPHKQEMLYGYPLAGKAGKIISKKLGYSNPFGLEVKEKSLKGRVSIINVSLQPLQEDGYDSDKDSIPSNINELNQLKRLFEKGASYITKHKKNELNKLKEEIYEIFLQEVAKLPDNIMIVPCGNFAREFSKKVNKDLIKKKFSFIEKKIPHPSARGGWSKVSRQTIDDIKNKL